MQAGFFSHSKEAVGVFLRRARDLLYPPECAFCGGLLPVHLAETGCCGECAPKLPCITSPFCACCGDPFQRFDPQKPSTNGAARIPVPDGHLCGRCLLDPPAFARARAATAYESPVREPILSLKHGRRFDVLPGLDRLLLEAFEKMYTEESLPSGICAVPLHPTRLRQREFDQAAVLGSRLARRAGVPFIDRALERIRKTPPQKGKKPKERSANVRGAFALVPGAQLAGKHLLLVDDVYTTGATVNECALTLRRKGKAARVDVLCVARVVRR